MMNGQCYCGEIQYTLEGEVAHQQASACWCKTCIRTHSIGSLNLMVGQEAFKIIKGEPKSFVDNKTDSGKPAVRFFCGNCSSTIYSRPEWIAGSLIVKVGTLDESDKVKTAMEIYVESALPNCGMKGDVMRFNGMMKSQVDAEGNPVQAS